MPNSLEPEARIGSYELVRRIGVGGMAEVWVARRVSERRANKYVAIKVVADQHVGDPRFQRMFKTEVELSALLNHVNIVQVFDEGEDDGRSYLVMEWVDGVNLLKVEAALTFIDDETWRLKVIGYVVGQLLYALNYAHSITMHDGNPLGIVHRDVSPQNVLVSAQGEVKLTDFGVAHYLLEESSGVHVKGKLRYMAPEQLAGKTRDPRIDLYAVGAILHELLDGRRFRHHVEDQREMYIDVISGKIPELSRSVPPELEALRLGLLEPDENKRIASADMALERLARFAGYGDARRELTQLCGGLTGVLRPRVGPAPSETAAAPELGIAASRMEASPAPSQATRGMPSTTASAAAVPAELPPKRSRTVPMGRVPAGHEPIVLDATQPWLATAVPQPVATVPSAPILTTNEPTDPVSPATSPMRPVQVVRPATRAVPWGAWVLASMVVAGLFGGGTWWVVTRGPAAPSEAVVEARAPEPTARLEAKAEQAVVKDDGSSERDGEAKSAGDVEPPKAPAAAAPEVEAAAAAAPAAEAPEVEEPAAEAPPAVAPAVEAPEVEEPAAEVPPAVAPAAEAPKPSPAKPSPAKAKPKQALTLVVAASLGAIQAEVRSKDGSIRKRYALDDSKDGDLLPVGGYSVKWRPVGASQWNPSQAVELRRGCDLRVIIGQQGIRSVPMGSGCG